MHAGRALELRNEFLFWARILDSLGGRPPGTWMMTALSGRRIEDLDLEEIEVLCIRACREYRVLIDGYNRVRYGR